VDIIIKEYESPYLSFAGNPVWLSDHFGADTSKPGSFSKRFMDFMNYAGSGNLHKDIFKGTGNAVKDAAVGAWDFVTSDAYKASTYKGMLSSYISFTTWASGTGTEGRQFADRILGTNSEEAFQYYRSKFDVRNWDVEDWSYNLTSGGLLLFGPKVTKSSFDFLNRSAASAFMKYSSNGKYANAYVPGSAKFTLKPGFSDNLIYHSKKDWAKNSRWSTETIFANPDDAFHSLALDYPGSANKAQRVFTSRAVGVYVESTAAGMGVTKGGATQFLKTRLSFTTGVTETVYPKFTLKSGLTFRGTSPISN
jgi:hypothetical protein